MNELAELLRDLGLGPVSVKFMVYWIFYHDVSRTPITFSDIWDLIELARNGTHSAPEELSGSEAEELFNYGHSGR